MTAKCQWCDEDVPDNRPEYLRNTGFLMHPECWTRMIVGSLGHIQKKCPCYGGKVEDPPEMTKRQAAGAVLQLLTHEWHGTQPRGQA